MFIVQRKKNIKNEYNLDWFDQPMEVVEELDCFPKMLWVRDFKGIMRTVSAQKVEIRRSNG